MRRGTALVLGLAIAGAAEGRAQGYQLRLDSRYQAVSFRGLAFDSIPVAAAVVDGAGFRSADGFAVDCSTGTGFCYYFRPGSTRRGHPVSSAADLTVWGFGVAGLTLHAAGRAATDLATGAVWPGSTPDLLLHEAYLEYASPRWTGRLGRQPLIGRLGYQGFDGARGTVRVAALGIEVGGYGGFGLARAVGLPVTSPVLDPLDDFQPRDRQLIVGADLGWRRPGVDVRAEYRREVDPTPDYLVSERAAASAEVRVTSYLALSGGAEYDFANGWWGSGEVAAQLRGRAAYFTAEARRYRPFFDLWTIWGAFSPVPYRAVRGSGGLQPTNGLWLKASGERYWFDEAAAETPLVSAEDRGWRASGSASYAIDPRLTVELGIRGEYGPGASSRGIDGSATFQPSDNIILNLQAGALERPLEFRYSDARARWLQAGGDIRVTPRLRLVTDLTAVDERRERPDAAAFDLDQIRLSTRLVIDIGGAADRLPKAVRRSGAGQ